MKVAHPIALKHLPKTLQRSHSFYVVFMQLQIYFVNYLGNNKKTTTLASATFTY